MENNPLKCGIGFADSEILSYHSENENVIVFLKAWNEEVLRMEFQNCISFSALCSWDISDICEVENSELFQKGLAIEYLEIPKEEHPYKLFHFLNLDGDPVIEVGCQNVNITRTNPLT